MAPQALKVLIVEDQALIRTGFSMMLKGFDTFHIVAEAENGAEAVQLFHQHVPEIVLMDIYMPVMDGIEATRRIKKTHPEARIIILTSDSDVETVRASLLAGADAYCLKGSSASRLVQVIQMVAEGGNWFDPGVSDALQSLWNEGIHAEEHWQYAGASEARLPLSRREQEVLRLLSEGKSNKEIADSLSLSVHTVKIHVGNIIQKMGVADRTQAAVKALQEGLLKAEQS